MPRWYLLVHRIPPRPLYLRAKIRQRLTQVGAIALKNSVYLLPQGSDALEDFEWIAQEIRAGGGEAHVFEGGVISGIDSHGLMARFHAARDADYEELAGEIRSAMKSARSAAAASGLAAHHTRLTRRFEEIRRIDFFDAPGRTAAEEGLASMEERMQRDRKEETRMVKSNPELRGKVWVTRPNVKVDRMASAWFVRRFIDPKARFRFADPSAPKGADEIRFDMVGGDFTHEEDRCTLETLIRRVGLPDRGVKAIAEIVHDVDLKDEKYGRAEAAGVRRIVEGLIARYQNDAERLDHGLAMFDDLHEALRPKPRGKQA
jgi:hypothetical protein